jgi:hypothetical protein
VTVALVCACVVIVALIVRDVLLRWFAAKATAEALLDAKAALAALTDRVAAIEGAEFEERVRRLEGAAKAPMRR